jgi:hypothetical protein
MLNFAKVLKYSIQSSAVFQNENVVQKQFGNIPNKLQQFNTRN